MNKKQYTYEKNKKAILKYKPQLEKILTNKAEYETLTPLFTEEISKLILEEEYKKHQLIIDQCSTGVVFCVEPNILKLLFKKYDEYRNLFLVFPSVDYFNTMLYNYDLSSIIKLQSFKPLLGNTEAQLEQNISHNCEKVDIMHNGIRVFAYQPFDKIDNKLLKKVMDVLKRIGMGMHINLNTSIIYGNDIFKNDMRSIDKQVKYQTLECLRDVAKGLPVVCVSGGPSLKKHIKFLKEIQDEVYIVAVAAVLKPLLKAGIKCDVYTSIDMDDIIEKYFMDVDLKGVKIAIEMSCYHGVMDNHPEADYIVSQSSAASKTYINDILETLNIRTPAESRIHGAMTVAMMSIQLANLMGASEVIMIGQDLAYQDSMSHVGGAEHSSSVQIVKQKDTNAEYLLFEDYGGKKNAALPLSWEDGWLPGKVPTTLQFVAYRQFMSNFFKNTGLHPINCTEGGMNIPECKNMTFKKAYGKYIAPRKVSEKHIGVARHREKVDISAGVARIEYLVGQFQLVSKICDDGIAELKNKKPDFDKVNVLIEQVMKDNLEVTNYVSQNNSPGYYLYKYLELAKANGDVNVAAIDRRNRARLLFGTVSKYLKEFIAEYELLLCNLKEV